MYIALITTCTHHDCEQFSYTTRILDRCVLDLHALCMPVLHFSKPALCQTTCSPTYPCDLVTVLHLVLYKTADLDFTTRERATHLLQILDKR